TCWEPLLGCLVGWYYPRSSKRSRYFATVRDHDDLLCCRELGNKLFPTWQESESGLEHSTYVEVCWFPVDRLVISESSKRTIRAAAPLSKPMLDVRLSASFRTASSKSEASIAASMSSSR